MSVKKYAQNAQKRGIYMQYAIETSALTKRYGKTNAVDNLCLKVPEGSIYGFLGPNGAGKSTTMKMILGLAKPDSGSVKVLGKTVNPKNRLEILRQTGSLIESPSYYGHLTGRENMQIIAMLKKVPEKEIAEILQIVRLENQQHKKVSHYSLGMKQRLGLACAMLGHPKILLLDEPTNGLDPAGIQEMRELIRSLPSKYAMTVLVSSHLLSEMDQMADYAGIIHHGNMIFQGELDKLHMHSRHQLLIRTLDNESALRLLQESKIPCKNKGGSLILPGLPDERTAHLVSLLVEAGVGVLRIEEQQMTLEEIFLHLTGKQVSL